MLPKYQLCVTFVTQASIKRRVKKGFKYLTL